MTLAGDVSGSLAGTMGVTQVGIEVRCFTGARALTGTGAGAWGLAGTGTWTAHGAAGEGARVPSTGSIHPGCIEDIFKLLPVQKTQC